MDYKGIICGSSFGAKDFATACYQGHWLPDHTVSGKATSSRSNDTGSLTDFFGRKNENLRHHYYKIYIKH
jgi:hypothetical protein